jgi:hypothetical protein
VPAKQQIRGTVVDSTTGKPIEGVPVAVTCVTRPKSTATGADGRFSVIVDPDLELGAIGPGVCGVVIERDGFLPYGDYASPEAPIKIALVHEAVITGTIGDAGLPLWGITVIASRRDLTAGRWVSNHGGQGQADKQGAFRIGGLAAGRYQVCVSAHLDSDQVLYAKTCYPKSGESEEWIELRSGESREVDLPQIPTPTARISGRVTNPGPHTSVSVRSGDGTGVAPEASVAWSDANGTFAFRATNGRYRIGACSDDCRLSAEVSVDLATDDVTGVELTLRPTPVLSGRFRMDDGSPWPKIDVLLDLVPPTASSGRVPVENNGSFHMYVTKPGDFRLGVEVSPPYLVLSATQGGRDAFEESVSARTQTPAPVDIVVTRSSSSIEGEVRLPIDRTKPPFIVLMRKRDGEFDMVGFANSDRSGRFQITNVTPGRYVLFAWDSSAAKVPYLEPDFLRTKEQFGREVEVIYGSTPHVEVEVVKVP